MKKQLSLALLMATALAGSFTPDATVNGINVQALNARASSGKSNSGQPIGQNALERIMGGGNTRGSRAYLNSPNGRPWTGVAGAKRPAQKRRNSNMLKRVAKSRSRRLAA